MKKIFYFLFLDPPASSGAVMTFRGTHYIKAKQIFLLQYAVYGVQNTQNFK
jgi:hypothetical protein